MSQNLSNMKFYFTCLFMRKRGGGVLPPMMAPVLSSAKLS